MSLAIHPAQQAMTSGLDAGTLSRFPLYEGQ
jgi:hypothetical protein